MNRLPGRELHPSDPIHSKMDAMFRTTANSNPTPQISGELTLDVVMGMQMSLRYDIVGLKENIMVLQNEMKTIRELLESHLVIQDEPDNYDMTPDQIRDLILEKVQVGVPFYASDIASKYGLDYDAVVTAIEQLRAKGKINDDV